MEDDVIIDISNVTVKYNIASENIDSMKEYFVKLFKGQIRYKELIALNNINLKIKKGESWGIVGPNGAGKSTLLKVVCSIISSSTGGVTVNGNISPMLELGSGFNGDLDAIENIYLQGALLGYSKSFMKEKVQEIIDFSELHDFINVPIKKYSSGMNARLAFAISTIVKPEILIVDEILSVGDAAFNAKANKRMKEMLEGSVTLLLVSHNSSAIKTMCQKAVWLNKGEIVMIGSANEVCDAYMQSIK